MSPPAGKTILFVSAVAIAAAALKFAFTLHAQRDEIAHLEDQATKDQADLRRLASERDRALAKVERLDEEARVAASGSEAEVDANARNISSRSSLLKALLARAPDQRIPEMRLLEPDDWISVVLHNPLQSENDFRKALADLRGLAKAHFARLMRAALEQYLQASQKQLPADISQLAPYFSTPVDDDMLQRYEVVNTPSYGSGSPGIRDKLSAIVDNNYDTLVHVGIDGGIGTSSVNGGMTISLAYALNDAMTAYRAANSGVKCTDPSQLLPYFKNSADGQQYLQLVDKLRR